MPTLTYILPLTSWFSNGEYTPWVHAMIGHVKAISVMHAIARWPILVRFMKMMLPASARQMRIDHVNFCIERVEERMMLQDARPDFWSLIVQAGTHRDINKQQLYAVMGYVSQNLTYRHKLTDLDFQRFHVCRDRYVFIFPTFICLG